MSNYRGILILLLLVALSGCVSKSPNVDSTGNQPDNLEILRAIDSAVTHISGSNNAKSCDELPKSKREDCRKKADALAESIARQKRTDDQ